MIDLARPMGDKIICQQVGEGKLEDQLASGLYIPQNSRDLHQRHMQAEIVSVGDGVQEPTLLPGLRVCVKRWSQNFIGDGTQFFVVRERDVEAVIDL